MKRWAELCARMGRRGSGEGEWLFGCLEAMYAFPSRAYHNLGHVGACLRVLDEVRGLAERADEMEFALWLHDCVYEPRRSDNEERSAKVAAMMGREIGCGAEVMERVRGLIMATTHKLPGATADQRLIADVDMSVLGAEWGEYERYAKGIRDEYSFAGEEAYRAGRGAFLRGMLAKERIFQTEELRGRWEAGARGNMQGELAMLGSVAP